MEEPLLPVTPETMRNGASAAVRLPLVRAEADEVAALREVLAASGLL